MSGTDSQKVKDKAQLRQGTTPAEDEEEERERKD
jgi:hypothetical protein